MESKYVYLSLGANQGNPLVCVQQALGFLRAKTEFISELKISHFYLTEPLYFESPHWFVNAVCSFLTHLTLLEVFEMTQLIEKKLGKVDKRKNEDRLIDIDLLFYGTERCKANELEIPHPRWKERLFVLTPLADLTQKIILDTEEGTEHYHVPDLIQSLKDQTRQTVSLLVSS